MSIKGDLPGKYIRVTVYITKRYNLMASLTSVMAIDKYGWSQAIRSVTI